MRPSKLFAGLFVVLLAGSIALSVRSALADTITGTLNTATGYAGYQLASPLSAPNGSTIYMQCSGGTGYPFEGYGGANWAGGSSSGELGTVSYLGGGLTSIAQNIVGFDLIINDIYNAAGTETTSTLAAQCGDTASFSTSSSSPAAMQISFYQPVPGSTAPDFADWELLAANMPTDGTIYRFDILYSPFGGGTSYDDFNLANSYLSPEILTIPKTITLPTSTEWYAQGFLYATSSTEDDLAAIDPGDAIATTSIIFFNIGTSTISTSSPPIASACPSAPPIFQLTGSLPYFVINNPIPSIISGGCNILSAGFIMSDAQTADVETRLRGAGNTIKTKPPIGYFALAIADMGTLSLASSSTSSILDATSTAAIYGVYEPLDAGCATVIGFMLLLWFFNRGRHFQL